MDFDLSRSLFCNGDINENTLSSIASEIEKLTKTDPTTLITLFLTSTGGNVADGFAIYDYIKHIIRPELQTVVLGEASSAAIMLFLLGQKEKRYMGPRALMRFHRFWIERTGALNRTRIQKIDNDLAVSENYYIDIIAANSKISKTGVRNILDEEATITAQRAVELGLAHEIL